MESVYIDSSLPEKETKIRCHFGECIMMENAAAALEKAVLGCGAECSVFVLCGGGNNGGDGLALAGASTENAGFPFFLQKRHARKKREFSMK